MFNSISRKSLVSLLVPWYAKVFVGRSYSVRAPKASSLISKASVPLSEPMLMVRLKKPAPGRHIWQVPSVVKVPLPDRVVPESHGVKHVVFGSAHGRYVRHQSSGRSNRITHLSYP